MNCNQKTKKNKVEILSCEDIKSFIFKNYNLKLTGSIPLEEGAQNTNFLIITNKGKSVLRIYNRKSAQDLTYTIRILLKLKDNRFPCPSLIPGINNKWVLEFDKKPCILYRYIEGKNTNKKSASLLKQIGNLQGKLHLILKDEKQDLDIIFNGGPGRIRTCDHRLRKPAPYPLGHGPITGRLLHVMI